MTLRYCSSAVDNSLAAPSIFPFFSVFSNSSLGIMLLVKKCRLGLCYLCFVFFISSTKEMGTKEVFYWQASNKVPQDRILEVICC